MRSLEELVFWPRARWLAWRHGMGRVIALVALRPSLIQALVSFSALFLLLPVLIVRLGLGYRFEWEALLVALVGGPLLWLFMQSDQVAICEGGALMGSFALPMRPFRIRWSEVDPATIVFVTPYKRVFDAIAPGAEGLQQMSSARRGPSHGQAALCFAGPLIRAAALGRMSMNEYMNTVHGGHLWCAGIGDHRIDRTRQALLKAWAPLLGPNLPRLERQLAAPIKLADDPRAAAEQLPGFVPPWR